jgi:hypothetical protein
VTILPSASLEQLEDEIRPLRERIEQIDRILEGPARTLIRIAEEAAKTTDSSHPPRFTLWLAVPAVPHNWPNALTTSLCLVTLHRLHRMGRRFPKLKKECAGLGNTLNHLRQGYLPDGSGTAKYFSDCSHFVDSRTFGYLNPFTSAQVFRLLMESGEDHAHTGVGCMAFFAMVWPLYHNEGRDPLDFGARIEPYRATAYVTAKCLLPLMELRDICTHRAWLFAQIVKDLEVLDRERLHAKESSLSHWKFCAQVDSLRRHVQAMAEVSIARDAFRACNQKLEAPLQGLCPRSDVTEMFQTIVRELASAIMEVAKRSERLLGDAEFILDGIDRDVLQVLRKGKVPDIREIKAGRPKGETRKRVLGFDRPPEELPANFKRYRKDRAATGYKALALCRSILDQLKLASALEVPVLPPAPQAAALQEALVALRTALKRMNDVNVHVASIVSGPVDVHTRWCHTVLNQHIAFATSGNFTDFDASELVSALAVGVRNQDLLTEAQVSKALENAVVGLEPDGSWRPPHPYFSADGLQALRAPAADVVWTLISALARFPRIRVADRALYSFVDWLERTQREIKPEEDPTAPPHVGWSADQMREQGRIELFSTAYAVNALLAVRDLVEHRLWELCKRRFTVVQDALPLEKMAAVDLAVPHGKRLHSQLSRMMRDTREAAAGADYSIVLHGPPGSSKTTVAGTLSHVTRGSRGWGKDRRLVRITPADFTRLGEDRVDAQAHAIFELLRHVRGVTILFDEVDDLLRRRDFGPGVHPRFLDLVIPAMLNRLQDLHDACEQQETCFLFGTNYVERIEPALMRRGRIDQIFAVPYPDMESRRAIAEGEVGPGSAHIPKPYDTAEWKDALLDVSHRIAEATGGWSWSGVKMLAANVRKTIDEGVIAHQKQDEIPVQPSHVIPDFDALVKAAIAENPPQIEADSIYKDRLKDGWGCLELRTECLRHALTYCTEENGSALRSKLVEQIDKIVPGSRKGDSRWTGAQDARKKLVTEADKLLRRLKLLDEAAAPPRPPTPDGVSV